MAMNKLMHPRNPYRKRPDFKQLAIDYPEFRKYAKQDLSGKINFNFKDHGAVWALTKCLLDRDFGLKVEILPGHLVPTLPLRLNYLLWIEDLLDLYKPKKVLGVDIGTGSNCIYPLLAAKRFDWKMLGTEIDIESTKCALANVENNYLNDKITVKAVTEDVILDGALEEDTFYDFCMCNPPFFADNEELSMEGKSRSPNRKPPNNAPTGVPKELITPGGESVFIARIIADSSILRERVRIYTVMVGKKSTLKPLKEMLRENDVTSITTTMFCQGRTTRWGLAWTYIPGLDLNQIENSQKKNKSSFAPLVYRIQKSETSTLKSVQSQLLSVLSDLQIETDQEESGDAVMVTVKAYENTWVNSRRKRRLEKKANNEEKAEDPPSCTDESTDKSQEATISGNNNLSNICQRNEKTEAEGGDENNEKGDPSQSSEDVSISKNAQKRPNEDVSNENESKRQRLDDEYLVASLILKDSTELNCIVIELYFLEGTGGKDASNQLLTYIKNKIK